MDVSKHAREAVRELEALAQAGDVQALVSASGELLARFDRRWQIDINEHRPVEPGVADFCFVSLHHCHILRQTERTADADATTLMTLLAVDVSGADVAAFPLLYLTLTYDFALGMMAFADASAADEFASAHTDVIARYAVRLFLAAYERLEPPSDNPWRGFAESVAASPLASMKIEINGHEADFNRPAEILVDILSRMNALGMV